MPISGVEAQKRALQKVSELRKLSRELCAMIAELPIPSPEEFEAMRRLKIPWTPEAYYAALIRNVDFHVDQARVLLTDYGNKTEESIAASFKQGSLPHSPDIERSLRYVVEERSGQDIPPSDREVYYHDPLARMRVVLGMLFRSATTVLADGPQQEIGDGERRPRGAERRPC
jgi:hypothetical protein